MMVCSKAARKEPAGGRVGGPSFIVQYETDVGR